MHRRYHVFALSTAFVLAACSTDLPIAPSKTVKAPSFALNQSRGGTYIVLTSALGVEKNLAARVEALGGKLDSYHAGAGFGVVSGLDAAAAAQLGASGIGTVQPDVTISLDKTVAGAGADASSVANEVIESQSNPTLASRYNFQWNMRLINAQVAWAAGKLGSPTVRVAIIDTGLDYDAPDLNGLVDLASSKSFMNHFVGRDDDPTTPDVNESDPIVAPDDQIVGLFAGRNLVTDLNGHGTNVATQVSSKAAALAGVTSKTTLFGVKVLGANGSGSGSDILNGVLWAADHGANVANMSLGGGFSKAGNGEFLGAINRVFNYAKQKGMLIVVAAGNSGIDLHHIGNGFSTYCDAPHVICVSSVGPALATDIGTAAENAGAFYTNFGQTNVDVAAPGGNADAAHAYTKSRWPWSVAAPNPLGPNDIASWVWSFCAKHTLVIQRNTDGVHGDLFLTSCFGGNRLTGFIGTSQASPHVAGLAALLMAEKGVSNPTQIKQLILKSGAPINSQLGRGRIDVAAALGL
jgi:subtilisin family serine protease